MVRPLRIQYENAYYHVTCRGNARQRIYSSDVDRSAFLDLLGRSSEIYQSEILAYVLMRNHFHLLVKTPQGNLQEFMRHFNIAYTSYYNRRYRRSGHLYQGRYHAFLIDADDYLKEVSRYIHLNPVKMKQSASLPIAARRDALKSYSWSSYPGYLSPSARRPFLRAEEVLASFGGDTAPGRRGYAKYVEEGLEAELESPLELGRGHGIVGDRDFIEAVKRRYIPSDVDSRELPAVKKILARLEPERIVRAVIGELGVQKGDLLKRGYRGLGRGLLMEMLYRHGGMNQREIGAMMGIDYSAVSVARKRFHDIQESRGDVQLLLEKVEKRISQE